MSRNALRVRFSRSERGFALITAVVLAILYFGLIQLMLIESSRELAEARRFRARIVALTLAENAIELGAAGLIDGAPAGPQKLSNDDGEMQVEAVTKPLPGPDGTFQIKGSGESAGTVTQRATVSIKGHIKGGRIVIDWSEHSQ